MQVVLSASRYAPNVTYTYARDQVDGAMVGSMLELNVRSKVRPLTASTGPPVRQSCWSEVEHRMCSI